MNIICRHVGSSLCCAQLAEQLFYFSQRGIDIEQAISLMINGFCQSVFNKLPMEFAAEADRLLSLKLEGSIG